MTPQEISEIRDRANNPHLVDWIVAEHYRTDIPKLLDEIERLESIRVEQWKVMRSDADELRIYKKALELCASSACGIGDQYCDHLDDSTKEPCSLSKSETWIESARAEIEKEKA